MSQTLTIAEKLDILKRLSPDDYHALCLILEDVFDRTIDEASDAIPCPCEVKRSNG